MLRQMLIALMRTQTLKRFWYIIDGLFALALLKQVEEEVIDEEPFSSFDFTHATSGISKHPGGGKGKLV